MNKQQILSTIKTMQKEGVIRHRRDCLLILASMGCRVTGMNSHHIYALTADGEVVMLSGYQLSTWYSATSQIARNVLFLSIWVAVLAGFIAHTVWRDIFAKVTTDETYWSSIPESMQTGINLWGYQVPAVFIMIALSCLVFFLLNVASEMVRYGGWWITGRSRKVKP